MVATNEVLLNDWMDGWMDGLMDGYERTETVR
jgi:hypothetical protein